MNWVRYKPAPRCSFCCKTATPGWDPALIASAGKVTRYLCSHCIEDFVRRCLLDGILTVEKLQKLADPRRP